ncbi:MAG: zinc dependent phospholipase C family protein [Termitinemataceae bacterium]
MPAQVLHVLFGKAVINECTIRLRNTYGNRFDASIEKLHTTYAPAFALGCQGPDIFYHNQRRKPVSIEYGSLLHRRNYGTFVTELLRRTLSPALTSLGAYALGFVTHAFLDRAAHPYIVYKSGRVSVQQPETAKYARAHAFFERILDVEMLTLLEGISIDAWDQERLIARACEEPPVYLAETLAETFRTVFPERACKDPLLVARMQNALLDAGTFYRITNPMRTAMNNRKIDEAVYFSVKNIYKPDISSVALIYPEKYPLSVDYLNLAHAPWQHPCKRGEIDYRSFVDIYSQTCSECVKIMYTFIANFIDTHHLPEHPELMIGNHGLSIVDGYGKPCKPLHSDPLPIDEILGQQYMMRRSWLQKVWKGKN